MENFTSITEVSQKVKELSKKFDLYITYSDYTDVTHKARINFRNYDRAYIQIYFNVKKDKFLLVLVKDKERIFGFDKLDNQCHEHPLDDQTSHKQTPCKGMDLEKFIKTRINIKKTKE